MGGFLMGQGYGCTCNKCGYSFSANLGVGFLFPMVYRETVGAMKKGEYHKPCALCYQTSF